MRLFLRIIFTVVLLAGPVIGVSLWLDTQGRTATATVTGRREQITFRRDPAGTWTRQLQVEVELTPPGSGRTGALVTVDAAQFDSLQRGDRVQVRYLSCCPIFARLADRTTATVLQDVGAKLADSDWLVWLPTGALGLWVAARMGTVPVLAVGLLWLAAAVPLFFQPRLIALPAGAEATAQVQWTSLVDRTSRGTRRRQRASRSLRKLPAPYQVVQLRFLPAGRTDSVLAADAVDSGSVPGLAHLAMLRVRYDPRAPREARLVQGTRTFPEKNRYHNLVPVLFAVGVGVFMALVWRVRRRRKRAAPAAPAPWSRGMNRHATRP